MLHLKDTLLLYHACIVLRKDDLASALELQLKSRYQKKCEQIDLQKCEQKGLQKLQQKFLSLIGNSFISLYKISVNKSYFYF